MCIKKNQQKKKRKRCKINLHQLNKIQGWVLLLDNKLINMSIKNIGLLNLIIKYIKYGNKEHYLEYQMTHVFSVLDIKHVRNHRYFVSFRLNSIFSGIKA